MRLSHAANKSITINRYLGTFISAALSGKHVSCVHGGGPRSPFDATGCRASSSSSLTAAHFLSRLAISILSGKQAGYFNALNCDSSHRSARMGARVTQHGSWDCFAFSLSIEISRRYRLNSGALYRSEKWGGFRRNICRAVSNVLGCDDLDACSGFSMREETESVTKILIRYFADTWCLIRRNRV